MRFLCPDLCGPQHKRVSELTYTLNNPVLEEFQVLMAAICWDAVPCIIVEFLTFQRCLLLLSSGCPDDGGSNHI
jgi:hypothetical protein